MDIEIALPSEEVAPSRILGMSQRLYRWRHVAGEKRREKERGRERDQVESPTALMQVWYNHSNVSYTSQTFPSDGGYLQRGRNSLRQFSMA